MPLLEPELLPLNVAPERGVVPANPLLAPLPPTVPYTGNRADVGVVPIAVCTGVRLPPP